ncbi:MAG: division/cell wall cluster transcriptional repressor MraZ [Patescibacteria group bacterium]|nr:division/cell wall cluster transcriptional repressor MraZ [Patescibacteria group bacterium]
MLIGEHIYKLGKKGRVALPKSFRDELGKKVIVTRGYEGCLIVVSPSQWKELLKEAATGPFVSESVRDTSRFLLGGAAEIELDDQGRFVIPPSLRSYAQLGDEVCFLGLGRWVEIWDKERWNDRRNYLAEEAGSIAEKLAEVEV